MLVEGDFKQIHCALLQYPRQTVYTNKTRSTKQSKITTTKPPSNYLFFQIRTLFIGQESCILWAQWLNLIFNDKCRHCAWQLWGYVHFWRRNSALKLQKKCCHCKTFFRFDSVLNVSFSLTCRLCNICVAARVGR